MSVSKEYRTLTEAWTEFCITLPAGDLEFTAFEAGWNARFADLSAILAQFEALAGKWKEAPDEETYYQYKEIYEVISGCADQLSALIQSVKERM